MKRIVILGAGFAGVSAYKELTRDPGAGSDFNLTVVSRDNFFLFTPLLHEVAAGHIDQFDPVVPARSIFPEGEFVRAEVLSVDLQRKAVLTSAGEMFYDYLIVSQGSETDFYGVPGAKENALTLKSLEDAVKIKNRICRRLEDALYGGVPEGESDFAIVGGGATGVELAAELAELFNRTIARYFRGGTNPFRVRLLDGGGELLSRFPQFTRSEAMSALLRAGVSVELGARVLEVTSDGVRYVRGKEELLLKSKNVIWTAGVRPAEIRTSPDIQKIKGRIAVDEFLMTDFPGVFAVGDGAVMKDDPQSSPFLAQAAEMQAEVAAKNIIALIRGDDLRRFRYHSKGQLVSLGRFRATGEVSGFKIRGFFGWWVWRTIYLLKMPSLKKKAILALKWTIDIFFRRELLETS